MQPNKTILEKIGMTDDVVKTWKDNGLEITFPMKVNKKYFKSADGEIFNESADKYVPHLTGQESQFYTKFPEKFRDIFLRNANFYFRFHTFLYEQSKALSKLKLPEEKLAASLALLYLFLSAMDHHYYHYDRYLSYQDYPETPVGYWWEKLKKAYTKVFKEKLDGKQMPPNFLKLLVSDKEVMIQCKTNLSEVSWNELKVILKVIKLFEDAQQKELEIVTGFPEKEDLLLKTGMGLWVTIGDLVKKNPSLVQSKHKTEISQILKGHPITSTRKLLLLPQLQMFDPNVFTTFETEIKKWLIH